MVSIAKKVGLSIAHSVAGLLAPPAGPVNNAFPYTIPFTPDGGSEVTALALNALGESVDENEAGLATNETNIAALEKDAAQINGRVRVKRLGGSNVQLALTGSTTNTVMLTINIPANTISNNALLTMTVLTSSTNNANAKTLRMYLNGTLVCQRGITSTGSSRITWKAAFRNSKTSQVMGGISTSSSNYSDNANTATPSVLTFDFTQAVTMTVQLQLGNAADTAALEMCSLIAYMND